MRNTFYRSILLTLVFLLLGRVLLPQSSYLRFQKVSVEHGLSQSVANCIIQDRKGFIWIGTDDGLNKYDGYKFTVYKQSLLDSTGLSGSKINTLFQDVDDNIWIGTKNGVTIFDPYYQKFKPFDVNFAAIRSEVSAIIEDHNRNIWIGFWKNGLIKYNPEDKSITKFSVRNENSLILQSNTIRCLALGEEGVVWVGSDKGLDKIYTSNNQVEHVSLSGKQYNINSLYRDKNSNLWIGTKDGLIKYHVVYKDYKMLRFKYHSKYINGFNNIRSIIQNNNNLWLATLDGGLIKFSLSDQDVKRYMHNNDDDESLANNRLTSLFVDKASVLWVGTWGGGLSITNLKQKRFSSIMKKYNIKDFPTNVPYGITIDENNNFWIASYGDGIFRIKPNGTIDNFISENANVKGKRYTDIEKDKFGNIWIGSIQNGLFKFDQNANSFIRFQAGETDQSILDNAVTDLLIDNNNILWVGTMSGINKYDPLKNKFDRYEFPTDLKKQLSSTNLCTDKYGKLWVSGNNQLYQFDLSRNIFLKQETISSNSGVIFSAVIFDIYADMNDNIWLCTDGNGLFKYNSKVKSITNYRETEGLPNNVLYSILPSKDGNLWMSTNKGLSRFNPKTNVFRNYYEYDGIRSNEFNWKSSFSDNEGNMCFGGIKGVTCFHPDSITDNNALPTVRFTNIRVNHKPVEINKVYYNKVTLEKDINYADVVYLSHKDYAISFEFSAMHYTNANKIEYKYFLEGVDENWITTDAYNRRASYTNLPHGDFIFKVKAANPDGVWNTNPTILKISIAPPFWKTWWFIVFAIINGLLLFYIIILLRLRQLKNQKQHLQNMVEERTLELLEKNKKIESQNKELEEHRNHLERMVEQRTADLKIAKTQAENSDKLKTSFLENISHEIRTPMNGIYGFSQLLDNKNLTSVKRVKYIDSIIHVTGQLLSVFNDLIDASKIHSKQLELTFTDFNLNKILDRIMEDAYQYLKETKKSDVELRFNNDSLDKNSNIVSDPHRITQIISKLVLNAIKFTDQGFVELACKIENSNIIVEVRDTGIGITPEKQSEIFNYFQQEDLGHSRRYGGVGVGLSIVQGLVSLLEGKIDLKSKKGAGTTFKIEIPVKMLEAPFEKKPYSKIKYSDWSNKKFLVVEDEDVNFLYINEIIQKTNASIIHAKSGYSAIELVKNTKFDLVLMDIKLPDISGIETTIKIRKFNKNIPIVAQTAHAMANDEKRCLDAGCDAYIAKPYQKQSLLDIISNQLK